MQMKFSTFAFLFLALVACGQDNQTASVDLSTTAVVWQGNIQENVDFMVTYNDVKQCLESFRLVNNPVPPYGVITEKLKTFIYNGQEVSACALFDTNTIYVSEEATWGTQQVFKHEMVHIISHLGNDAHNTDPFLSCAGI